MTAPYLGAPLHYVSQGSPVLPDGGQVYPSVCRLANVTECLVLAEHRVGLVVLNPTGFFFRPLSEGGSDAGEVDEDDGARMIPGSWHWPSDCPAVRS